MMEVVMGKASESIFSGKTKIIPMADVQHIERYWYSEDVKKRDNYRGITIITKNTKWNFEHDVWENGIYLAREEADKFIRAWCDYRAEIESELLKRY